MQTARDLKHKERKKPFLNKFTLQYQNNPDIYYALAFHMSTAHKKQKAYLAIQKKHPDSPRSKAKREKQRAKSEKAKGTFTKKRKWRIDGFG